MSGPTKDDLHPARLPVAMVLLACLFPRLMLVGGPPATDEGYYAYFAQLIHHSLSIGQGLPDSGPLMLYPMLLSWIFELSGNHLVMLRIADMVMAAAAGWLLFRVVRQECGGLAAGTLISVVFVFTMNQEQFIQFGHKNSITAAFVPLLLALHLSLKPEPEGKIRWMLVGVLTAVSVLLRETFLPFAILGLSSIVIAHGWQAGLRFAAGGILTATSIVAGIVIARGGFAMLLDGYRGAGAIYAALANHRVSLFLDSGWLSVKEAAVALGLAGVATFALLKERLSRDPTRRNGRFAFWLAAAFLPLIEPLAKTGYPYHFAVCLPALAGLSALGWREIPNSTRAVRSRLSVAAALSAILLLPGAASLGEKWPASRDVLGGIATNGFPAAMAGQSNYLLAADLIRNNRSADATLGVSGFMYPLYPLTGLLPPSPELANLSATLIRLDLDGERLKQLLLACPPGIAMTTTRDDLPGSKELINALEATGAYQKVATVAVAHDRAYGSFGGDIYRRITPNLACTNPRLGHSAP